MFERRQKKQGQLEQEQPTRVVLVYSDDIEFHYRKLMNGLHMSSGVALLRLGFVYY